MKAHRNHDGVHIAATAGFCFGVRRAIDLAEKTARISKNRVYTLGPLIHNPQEVNRLKGHGIKALENVGKIKKATLILRTHGIPAAYKEKLESSELNLVDATCPFVKRAQDLVKKLHKGKYQVIIVGEKTHPEVVALVSYANSTCCVVEKKSDLDKIKLAKKVGVVCQTTQTPENFNEIIDALKAKRPDAVIFNTICMATIDRQNSARALAAKTGLMLVVGGKNSGNTKRLYEICSRLTKTMAIETASELKCAWFKGVSSVGITAGASTPKWIIENVKVKAEKLLAKNKAAKAVSGGKCDGRS